MDTYFVKNNSSNRLYLCFLGWGMDERPMLPLIKDENVLFLFNAKNLDFSFDFTKYNDTYLLAFSYGVMQASLLQKSFPKPVKSIAVNGTLHMEQSNKGLPLESRHAMRHLDLTNYLEFRRKYLLSSDDEFNKFNENAPLRSIDDCMKELDFLEKIEKQKIPEMTFDQILVSDNDHTVPTKNQLNAWKDREVCLIKGNHFPFYQFDSISDLFLREYD